MRLRRAELGMGVGDGEKVEDRQKVQVKVLQKRRFHQHQKFGRAEDTGGGEVVVVRWWCQGSCRSLGIGAYLYTPQCHDCTVCVLYTTTTTQYLIIANTDNIVPLCIISVGCCLQISPH